MEIHQQKTHDLKYEEMVKDTIQIALIEMMEILLVVMVEARVDQRKLDLLDLEGVLYLKIHVQKFEVMEKDIAQLVPPVMMEIRWVMMDEILAEILKLDGHVQADLHQLKIYEQKYVEMEKDLILFLHIAMMGIL